MRSLKPWLQWLLLAAAGSASFYASLQWSSARRSADAGPVVAAAVAPPPAAPASAPVTASAASRYLAPPDRSRGVPRSGGDAFKRLSWLPPPPPPVVPQAAATPAAPAAAQAPPLPFTFVGLVERGTAKPRAFLARGDTLLVVAAGDVIEDNTYRLDSLSAQQIVLTYLPLNIAQTLTIPGAPK